MSDHKIEPERRHISAWTLFAWRAALLSMIVVTSLLPLAFVQVNEPGMALSVFWILAKIGALVGGMLLLWQFLLGFRGAVSKVLPDLAWNVELHKNLGKYGIPVIILHPVFITMYYLEKFDQNLFTLDLSQSISVYALVGIILFTVIAFIVISSTFFREAMSFYRWLYAHFSSYVVPPLLFIHSITLGSTVGTTPLWYIWWSLAGIMSAFYLYRILHKLGGFTKQYQVKSMKKVADSITDVVLVPLTKLSGFVPSYKRLVPAPASGQFIYIRENTFRNAHPYTVSDYSEETGELTITPKALGFQSSRLQNLPEGKVVVLEGPFGIFTRVTMASGMPVVMVAGGIGITPFRRVWRRLEQDHDRETYLFYGSEFLKDIAYREELDSLNHVKVIYVLNREPDYEGETGFITVEVLQKHTRNNLHKYRFMMCGPPVMVKMLEADLHKTGVPKSQIHHELFSH